MVTGGGSAGRWRPHTPEFAAAWRDLVLEVFRWRSAGEMVRVPSLSGRATLSYLPLLNYTDLSAEQATRLARSVADRQHLIRVLEPAQADFESQSPCVLRLELSGQTAEDVWQDRLNAKCRNQIRKARKSPTTLRVGRDGALSDDFYRLFAGTSHRYGAPVLPRALFDGMARRLEATFYVTYYEERPIASLVAVRDDSLLWVPWAASEREFLNHCPNHRIYWRAIRDAVEQGLEVFDFGRSPHGSNTFRFKTQWGAEPVAISFRSRDPVDIHAKYELAQRLWQAAPRRLVDRLGPALCRYLADY